VARERERARQAQRREGVDAQVAGLRHEARRWLIRAVLAAIAGVAVSFAFVTGTVLLGLVAAACVVQGMRIAVTAQKLDDSG
jgi:hypothetical protein